MRLPDHSSSRLQSFFAKNIFRTGYATHGLFPYRGKFHPQMIRGLINIMGLKPGDTILDPMMGSGTVPVEATLMGIHSVGIDISPFCRFMAQTKYDALTMTLTRAKNALLHADEVFAYFQRKNSSPEKQEKARHSAKARRFVGVMEEGSEYGQTFPGKASSEKGPETIDTYNLLLLAYLDSVGYSQRSSRATPVVQFKAILERYVFVVEKIQHVLAGCKPELGESRIMEGDARRLPLSDSTVDGIIFSPPYSFAIDYLKNDSFHLAFLKADLSGLRENMVGLRGGNLLEKFEFYKDDMTRVLAECARVLRPGKMCVILVGTNTNQLSKVLRVDPNDVLGLDEILAVQAKGFGLNLVKTMSRPITGISNTMRREEILMLVRN